MCCNEVQRRVNNIVQITCLLYRKKTATIACGCFSFYMYNFNYQRLLNH